MTDKIILPGTLKFYSTLGQVKPSDDSTLEEKARKVRYDNYDEMDTTTREYVDQLNEELDADALLNGECQWKRLAKNMPPYYAQLRESIIGLPADSEIWRPIQFELAATIRDDLDAGHIIGYLKANPITRGFFEKIWRFITRKD